MNGNKNKQKKIIFNMKKIERMKGGLISMKKDLNYQLQKWKKKKKKRKKKKKILKMMIMIV